MESVRKTQFAGLNDKRFYFQDGIVSLPFGQFFVRKNLRRERKTQK